MNDKMYTRFTKQTSGIMTRIVHIDIDDKESFFKIEIDGDKWDSTSSKAASYWIRNAKKGKIHPFKYGTITNITNEQDNSPDKYSKIYVCDICNKQYMSPSGFYKHKSKCKQSKQEDITITVPTESIDTSETNIREYSSQNINSNNNNDNRKYTVVNVQNNVTIRDLGKENPKWLTSQLLYQVLNDIPTAIPKLLEKKHFNDAFPENKNLKVDTKRAIDKRLQVFEDGRWRVKGSKKTFYKVLLDIHDVLADALENDVEDTEEPLTDESIPEDERAHTYNELVRLKRHDRFIKKLERIRPIWEDFREKINDQEQRSDLWEDLKTMLLDRQLAIDQGYD